MKLTEILVSEHTLIKDVLNHLSDAVERMKRGEGPPREFFEKTVEFVHTIADKLHHVKEEYLLFTRLAQKKSGALDAEIEILRNQHERGRELIGNVIASLDGYVRGGEVQRAILQENLTEYIQLLRNHITKEETVFYPMVDEHLSDEEQQKLLREFEAGEQSRRIGSIEDGRRIAQEMGALL